MERLAEPYIRRRAIRHLEKGRLVIFAAGTGNPYLHDRHGGVAARHGDRRRDRHEGDARRRRLRQGSRTSTRTRGCIGALSYLDVLNSNLAVMDSTAISLCRDNTLPILVFNMTKPGNIRRVVLGEPLGTLVLDERQRAAPALA